MKFLIEKIISDDGSISETIVGAVCPICSRQVKVVLDKIVGHDTSSCNGAHITYGSCKGSGFKVKE